MLKKVKDTGEVFTPDFLVNDVLNKLPAEMWEENKTFLDPACGDGQFLVNVLIRKIGLSKNIKNIIKSIYGVDIIKENIYNTRVRMLNIISQHEKIDEEHIKIIINNIKWLDIAIYPNGSLDYDFEFNSNIPKDHIDIWNQKWNLNGNDHNDMVISDDSPDIYIDIFSNTW